MSRIISYGLFSGCKHVYGKFFREKKGVTTSKNYIDCGDDIKAIWYVTKEYHYIEGEIDIIYAYADIYIDNRKIRFVCNSETDFYYYTKYKGSGINVCVNEITDECRIEAFMPDGIHIAVGKNFIEAFRNMYYMDSVFNVSRETID